MQHGQGFFEVKTSFLQLLVSVQQVRKVATFLQSVFLVKKMRRASNTTHRQLLIEN
jgi:hypothetical protein